RLPAAAPVGASLGGAPPVGTVSRGFALGAGFFLRTVALAAGSGRGAMYAFQTPGGWLTRWTTRPQSLGFSGTMATQPARANSVAGAAIPGDGGDKARRRSKSLFLRAAPKSGATCLISNDRSASLSASRAGAAVAAAVNALAPGGRATRLSYLSSQIT